MNFIRKDTTMYNFNLPDFSAQTAALEKITLDVPTRYMWSDTQFEIIREYIEQFESSLDPEHEVGVMLTNFGQSILMQVTHITYEKSVLMIFKGFVNGREATLIQHINQLNFMLTSVEKEPDRPKRKIGFATSEE